MPFTVGENVGPYRIIEQLGQGGMATVYKAYHASLDRYVALKALHPGLGSEASFVARFQREARLVARLDHPHIVPIYDFAEHEGRPYLVMKFIEGSTLKARLASGPLSAAEISGVVDSVGSALAYAHRQGILHRDIKPSNVLITTQGQMFLADFGLARIAQDAASTLSSDAIMGTPQYISPEQARGEQHLMEATDVYSFGVLLYELVVGDVPFNADTPYSIIHDHIYSPLPLPRARNPRIPESVQRVLLKALAKMPADRYADVASLMREFMIAWDGKDLPMAGSLAPISAAARGAEAATILPPQIAPVQMAGHSAGVAKTPRSRTMYAISAGVLGLLCILVLMLAVVVRNRIRSGAELAGTSPGQLQVTPPGALPGPVVPVSSLQAAPSATVAPALRTALAAVELSPKDAKTALALSLAYWDAGMFRPSIATLDRAFRLAGARNAEFFRYAGNEFKSREAWLPAAASYRLATGAMLPSPGPSAELVEAFREALYKAAESPDFLSSLPLDSLDEVDQEIVLVAQARHTLYNGERARARQLLDKARLLKTHLPEMYLLEAEMDLAEGNSSQASQILVLLIADLNTPGWIKQMAEILADQIR